MSAYDPRLAVTLTLRGGAPSRRVVIISGLTLAHIAAAEMAGADEFATLARTNSVLDPIPFDRVPPRHVRRGALVTGDRLAIPDGELL